MQNSKLFHNAALQRSPADPHSLLRRISKHNSYLPTSGRSAHLELNCVGLQTVGLPDLPATYKRLVARTCGASFRQVAAVQELPLNPPGSGEVLIRITHAGINGGCETFRVRGEHAFAANRRLKDFPLGAEGAGVVAAIGPDTGGSIKVGQRVAINGAAAFSEYVTARPSYVTVVPEQVSNADAVALVLSGVTASAALEVTGRVQPGEVVAVTAAAGGTGHLAVQLAAAAGATIVAVVGGAPKAAAVAALGATHVVDYHRQDVVATLQGLFPQGLDVVYDGVGGPLRDQMLMCLGHSGRLLQPTRKSPMSNRLGVRWLRCVKQVGYISEYPHALKCRWEGQEDDARERADGSGGGGGSGQSDGSIKGSRDGDGGVSGSIGCRVKAGEGDTAPVAASQPTHLEVRGAAPYPRFAATTTTTAAATPAAVKSPPMTSLPTNAELFWGGLDVMLGQKRIIGQIWPKDLKAILRCRRRVFELARRGQLRVLTDQGHGRQGVEGVADAVDYMLQGGHIGKVIIEI
ncbi:hypothetical protein VaNZ11_016107 [Volvox africanus]|uniref:Enoyl reductase (ER) domain-containing protein n=1 Tax=Volvox africanus TaxID=51714 RepID=A0ABQ5SLX1_9CHLO|nr:hypothetical protein VaNZ11_016107 [Volvox africanus]